MISSYVTVRAVGCGQGSRNVVKNDQGCGLFARRQHEKRVLDFDTVPHLCPSPVRLFSLQSRELQPTPATAAVFDSHASAS
jgi:hypothetical protein